VLDESFQVIWFLMYPTRELTQLRHILISLHIQIKWGTKQNRCSFYQCTVWLAKMSQAKMSPAMVSLESLVDLALTRKRRGINRSGQLTISYSSPLSMVAVLKSLLMRGSTSTLRFDPLRARGALRRFGGRRLAVATAWARRRRPPRTTPYRIGPAAVRN